MMNFFEVFEFRHLHLISVNITFDIFARRLKANLQP